MWPIFLITMVRYFLNGVRTIAQEVVDVVYGGKLVGSTQCKH